MNNNYDTPERRQSSLLPFGPKTWLMGAGSLIVYGIKRRSKAGTAMAAAGSVLALAAARSANRPSRSHAIVTFLVNSSEEAAYQLWRNFENLPRFMSHLKSVRQLDSQRSEWTVDGPGEGGNLRWTAEITQDVSNERIGWRSLPDSQVKTAGHVEFRRDPQGRGTFVTASVHYDSPGGIFGRAIAAMLGKHPDFMVREDLRHFKALLETGEVPTTLGQTHGPRGMHGKSEQFLFRETVNLAEPQATQSYRKSA